jgi:enamine deaminase RidA (YjgF/YER057c/UK114 family)
VKEADMLTTHALDSIYPHTNNAAHGVEVPAGARLVFTNGQVGARRDGTTPEAAGDQAEVVFERIEKILEAGGMTLADVVRFTVYLTDRAHRDPFFAVRDRVMGENKPGATILIISGLAREELKIEIEAVAAKVD